MVRKKKQKQKTNNLEPGLDLIEEEYVENEIGNRDIITDKVKK